MTLSVTRNNTTGDYIGICLGLLRRTTKTLFTEVSVPRENETGHLPNSLHVKHQIPPVQSFDQSMYCWYLCNASQLHNENKHVLINTVLFKADNLHRTVTRVCFPLNRHFHIFLRFAIQTTTYICTLKAAQ